MATKTSRKRCLRMESLPHDVVERILERLAVNTLLRLKVVSKQWKATIESRHFQERQLKQRERSGDPDVLMVSVFNNYDPVDMEPLKTLVLGSSSSVKIPSPWDNEKTDYAPAFNSCDGLVCIYHPIKSGFVINPTTRWYRPLPLCEFQQLMIDSGFFSPGYDELVEFSRLAFGKDILTGTYKPVWLYNSSHSSEIGLANATTCQVFDFSTNAWRYVTPAAPYRIVADPDPVIVDGSLHWFTECQETKLVSFDLHTETFQVISKAPFVYSEPRDIVMCNLDNRLCVSQKKWPDQVIWSFNSNNKTWNKMCSIELDSIRFWYGIPEFCALQPLALLEGDKKKKKKKLLFYDRMLTPKLFTHDPESNFDDVAFSAKSIGSPVCYYQSLISIL